MKKPSSFEGGFICAITLFQHPLRESGDSLDARKNVGLSFRWIGFRQDKAVYRIFEFWRRKVFREFPPQDTCKVLIRSYLLGDRGSAVEKADDILEIRAADNVPASPLLERLEFERDEVWWRDDVDLPASAIGR